MNFSLKGKKVLYLYMEFYGYHLKIKSELEKFGAHVDIFRMENFNHIFSFLNHTYPDAAKAYQNYNQSKLFTLYKNETYDYVFIVEAFTLSSYFLDKLKSNFKNSTFILYNWDGLKSCNYLPFMGYFEKVFSYDPVDCRNHESIKYLPLFFCQEYENVRNSGVEKDIDILFVGTLNSEKRYNFINKIREFSNDNQLVNYLFIYQRRRVYLRLLLKGKYYKNISHISLSMQQVVELFSRSRVVIDLPNPKNQGLTMRTFEVLGSGLKLITTNPNIKCEPFYDPKFIHLTDPQNIDIDLSFIRDYSPMPFNNISNYSLRNWLGNIFS